MRNCATTAGCAGACVRRKRLKSVNGIMKSRKTNALYAWIVPERASKKPFTTNSIPRRAGGFPFQIFGKVTAYPLK